jgi:hypothetical protein
MGWEHGQGMVVRQPGTESHGVILSDTSLLSLTEASVKDPLNYERKLTGEGEIKIGAAKIDLLETLRSHLSKYPTQKHFPRTSRA